MKCNNSIFAVIYKHNIILALCLVIQCSGQNSSTCNVAGETCIDRICRCGPMSSCQDRKTGSFCNSTVGECRCSENLESCSDPSRGNICELSSNSCKCSESAAACNGSNYCILGSCIGNSLDLEHS